MNYDFKHIEKLAKKYGIFPKGMWNPFHVDFEKCGISFFLSERSVGKTTALLLIGLLLNQEYNVRIHYIRTSKDELRQSIVKDLFTTIINCGYVEKITQGRYNFIIYKRNEYRWYFANIDSDGNIEEISPECFMFGMSIDKSQNYKSGYQCDRADWIIVDEFMQLAYQTNYFTELNDIFSTLLRFRSSGNIIFLANTINAKHFLFSEYAIENDISSLQVGKYKYTQSPLGANIYMEWIADKTITERKKDVNKRFFGFNNPKLNAIRGGSEWLTKIYPHRAITDKDEKLTNIVYIEDGSTLLNLTMYYNPDIGLFAYVRPATKTYIDSYIYTRNEVLDNRYHWNMGRGNKLDNLIFRDLLESNLIFFATNSAGLSFETYVHACRIDKLNR